MIILGIDPGTRVLGFGVVEKTEKKIQYLDHGFIKINEKAPFLERLGMMADKVSELFQKVKPQSVAIEKIFLGRNVDSAFKLGHIRGVCIFEGHKVRAQVFEYTPRSVKLGITGSGSASKEQVQMLLYSQLGLQIQGLLAEAGNTDASDGLSLAYHHATQIDVIQRLQKRGVEL